MLSGPFVVDASVLLKLVLAEADSEAAAALLQAAWAQATAITAPEFVWGECANVLRTAVRKGTLPPLGARTRYRTLERLPVRTLPDQVLVAEALELALVHDLSVYDALYVAAAVDCPLVTGDARLARKMAGAAVRVLTLAEAVAVPG